jgi:hypothetical protein
MAPKALGWAFAVVVLGGAVANAQVDLGKMLGSLTFGNQDPPSATSELPPVDDLPGPDSKTLPLTDIAAPDLENIGNAGNLDLDSLESSLDQDSLLPATTDIELPELPSLDPSSPAVNDHHAGELLPRGAAPTDVRDVPAVPSPLTLDHSDLVGAGPEGSAPVAAGSRVNWEDVLQSAPTTNMQVGNCHVGATASVSCGCQSAVGCNRGCGNRLGMYPFGEKVLRETPCLDVPNLPPPASCEGSYRTPACYRDLWSGFAEQRAADCQAHHVHLHGHCGCASGTCGSSASCQTNSGCNCAKAPQGGVRR